MFTIGRMMQYGGGAVLAGLAMTTLAPAPAVAGAVTFAYGSLANNATDATIQSFMNTALAGIGSVVVTGAVASNSYNADGHVTGPSTRDGTSILYAGEPGPGRITAPSSRTTPRIHTTTS